MHNNLEAAKRDLALNKPLVITHDFYPFFNDPRSGPTTPERSWGWYRRNLENYYRACRENNASFWMMPQSWGFYSQSLDPPEYGFVSGYRTPTAEELKLQAWYAVAYGATGVIYFHYHATSPSEEALWSQDWKETQMLKALGELFGKLKRVASLLCQLERDYQEKALVEVDNPKILAHTFRKRSGSTNATNYIVVVNTDTDKPQKFALKLKVKAKSVHDMVQRQDVTKTKQRDSLSLPPGEGTVYRIE